MGIVRFFLLLYLSGTVANSSVYAEQGMAIDPVTCMGCHNERFSIKDYAASVHGKNACTSCHTDITDIASHMQNSLKVQKVQCERCHKRENAEHYTSIHIEKGVMCADCHTDVHTHTYWKNDKRIVVAKCLQCHEKEAIFQRSIHGKAVEAGNKDSAACHDCHNLHAIRQVGGKNDHASREFHTKVCMKCHSDTGMMRRNNIFNVAVKTYMESFHGKNYRLGYPEKVAGCADCHTAHAVLPKHDPASSVNSINIVKTCAKCHKGVTASFIKFYAHADPADRHKFPILFYTLFGMTALLVCTFVVFWVHTLFWMFRGFIENRHKHNRYP